MSPSRTALTRASAMGSASGTSISATHRGSTSGPYCVHLMLVRVRSWSRVSAAKGLAAVMGTVSHLSDAAAAEGRCRTGRRRRLRAFVLGVLGERVLAPGAVVLREVDALVGSHHGLGRGSVLLGVEHGSAGFLPSVPLVAASACWRAAPSGQGRASTSDVGGGDWTMLGKAHRGRNRM